MMFMCFMDHSKHFVIYLRTGYLTAETISVSEYSISQNLTHTTGHNYCKIFIFLHIPLHVNYVQEVIQYIFHKSIMVFVNYKLNTSKLNPMLRAAEENRHSLLTLHTRGVREHDH
jgi:hypothetical protein